MPGMIQPRREIHWEMGPDGEEVSVAVTVYKLFPPGSHPTTLPLRMKRRDYDRWQGGEYIQDALPYLTADEREFLLSGTTAEEWDALWKDDDPA